MKHLLKASALAPLLVLAAPAQADLLRSVALSGSEVLVTHTLSLQGMPQSATEELDRFKAMRGYTQRPGVEALTDFRIRPTLSFDRNVNGGVPNSTIDVAGLTFNIDPEFVGKSDIMVGVEAMGAMRRNLSEGLSFGLQGRVSVERAPRVGVNRIQADIEACLRQKLSASRFIHGCAGAGYASVKLGSQTALNGVIGFTQAFGTGQAGLHAVTVELGARHIMPGAGRDFTQGFVRLSSVHALQSGMVLNGRLEIGQSVKDIQVTRLRASLGAIRDIAGRPTGLSVNYSRSEGSMFLGQKRRDHNIGLSVTRQMTDKISLTANITQTRSSASLFNTGPVVGFGLKMNF